MSATVQEFKDTLAAFRGAERYPEGSIFERVKRRLGFAAAEMALYDIYDAVEVREIVHTTGVGSPYIEMIGPKLVARMFVPMENRAAALRGLEALGVGEHDLYPQVGKAGNILFELSLTDDEGLRKAFRSYAATRKLLDNAPEEGGVVDVPQSAVNLAVTGEE